ncbi:hypothetical protein KI387_028021, partial [Taxus chinensis]
EEERTQLNNKMSETVTEVTGKSGVGMTMQKSQKDGSRGSSWTGAPGGGLGACG